MSRLAELQEQLRDVTVAIARAERAVAAHPNIPSALATLQGFEKRRANLEAEFLRATYAIGLDVCGYRIELNDRPATIGGMTAVLGNFQKVFTSVYDALIHGRPKQTSKMSADTIATTAFGFAYTYPGSIGVMMTLANDWLLVGDTKLDEAMKVTFQLLKANDPEKVQAMTEKVGLPAVRFAHQWALENTKAHFGVDIKWYRDEEIKEEIRLQLPEIAQVAESIQGSTAKEQVIIIGELLDVSLSEHSFKMKVSDGIIQGTFNDAIGAAHPALLPRTYRAFLTVAHKVVIEEGKEETTYFLVRLEPPDTAPLSLTDLSSL